VAEPQAALLSALAVVVSVEIRRLFFAVTTLAAYVSAGAHSFGLRSMTFWARLIIYAGTVLLYVGTAAGPPDPFHARERGLFAESREQRRVLVLPGI
jgi:hypothetical protein